MTNLVILGISGSPRQGGNTDVLVKEALSAAETVEGVKTDFLGLAGKKISPCISCNRCFSSEIFKKSGADWLYAESGLPRLGDELKPPPNGRFCMIEDDMEQIYKRLIEADGIITGSPVYWGGVTAQLKALMDRTEAISYSRGFPLKDKVGGAISVGFQRHGGQEWTIDTLHHWMMGHRMIVVGIDPGYCYGFGIAGGSLLELQRYKVVPYYFQKGAIKYDEIGVKAANKIGKRVAEIARLVKKAKT